MMETGKIEFRAARAEDLEDMMGILHAHMEWMQTAVERINSIEGCLVSIEASLDKLEGKQDG